MADQLLNVGLDDREVREGLDRIDRLMGQSANRALKAFGVFAAGSAMVRFATSAVRDYTKQSDAAALSMSRLERSFDRFRTSIGRDLFGAFATEELSSAIDWIGRQREAAVNQLADLIRGTTGMEMARTSVLREERKRRPGEDIVAFAERMIKLSEAERASNLDAARRDEELISKRRRLEEKWLEQKSRLNEEYFRAIGDDENAALQASEERIRRMRAAFEALATEYHKTFNIATNDPAIEAGRNAIRAIEEAERSRFAVQKSVFGRELDLADEEVRIQEMRLDGYAREATIDEQRLRTKREILAIEQATNLTLREKNDAIERAMERGRRLENIALREFDQNLFGRAAGGSVGAGQFNAGLGGAEPFVITASKPVVAEQKQTNAVLGEIKKTVNEIRNYARNGGGPGRFGR